MQKYSNTVAESEVPEYTGVIEETEAGFVLTNSYTAPPPTDPDDPEDPDDPDLPVDPDWHDPVPPHKPDVPDVPDMPDAPEEPPVPVEPSIPQAGFRMWPVYAMLVLGFAMVVFGLTDLYLRREEVYEEEWEEEPEISS